MQFIDLRTQYQRISDSIIKGIHGVLEHGQYIMGPEIAELEKQLAAFVGVKHCIALSSGTDALMMALMALGIGPGDEVITTPLSFFATAEMISVLGAKPVFVDIDPRTYNINPEGIEAAITSKTKAIMPVSLYGQCADFTAINAIAARHHLPVIEDAAQSFGARYKGKFSCGLSTIGCTSFFPSKPLGGYGDSGAIFTNDDELGKHLSQIRNHGQDVRYNHPQLGINGRMDSMQAAILLEKLKIFPEEIELRNAVARRYDEGLKDCSKTPFIHDDNFSVYAQYTILVEDRDSFAARLAEHNIPTAVHYPRALHQQPVYKNDGYGAFPHSEYAAAHVISLPMHPYLSEENQQTIIEVIRGA